MTLSGASGLAPGCLAVVVQMGGGPYGNPQFRILVGVQGFSEGKLLEKRTKPPFLAPDAMGACHQIIELSSRPVNCLSVHLVAFGKRTAMLDCSSREDESSKGMTVQYGTRVPVREHFALVKVLALFHAFRLLPSIAWLFCAMITVKEKYSSRIPQTGVQGQGLGGWIANCLCVFPLARPTILVHGFQPDGCLHAQELYVTEWISFRIYLICRQLFFLFFFPFFLVGRCNYFSDLWHEYDMQCRLKIMS